LTNEKKNKTTHDSIHRLHHIKMTMYAVCIYILSKALFCFYFSNRYIGVTVSGVLPNLFVITKGFGFFTQKFCSVIMFRIVMLFEFENLRIRIRPVNRILYINSI